MATIIKNGKKWRAQVCKKGITKTATFVTRIEEVNWANFIEAEIEAGRYTNAPDYPYKHRNVRSAYHSFKRYMDYLFTYEKYGDLNIEKTANRLENLFGQLKEKLSRHAGLTKRHNVMFIKDFLNKNSW